MSTSGTSVFTINRDQIIRQAMLNLGALDGDEVPTPQETNDCAFILNMMVKQWQGKADFAPGLKTWMRRRGYLFLSSTVGEYTVGPAGDGWTLNFVSTTTSSAQSTGATSVTLISVAGLIPTGNVGIQTNDGDLQWRTITTIVGNVVSWVTPLPLPVDAAAIVYGYTTTATQPIVVEAVSLRDSTGNDLPMRIMSQEQYDSLPSKASLFNQGDPTAIYYEFQLGNSNLYLDSNGVVDVSRYLVITYLDASESFILASDEPAYPQEWYLPICWGLTELIAPMFHVDFTPQMLKVFTLCLAIAQRKEPEVSATYFQVGIEP